MGPGTWTRKGMELRSSGGVMQACRRGGVCLKRSGGVLRVYGRVGIRLRSSGGMLRALIYKRSGDALQACCL